MGGGDKPHTAHVGFGFRSRRSWWSSSGAARREPHRGSRNMAGPLSKLVERARAEFAGCLALVQDGPASSTDDLEVRTRTFLDVATELQQGIAQAQRRTTLSGAELRQDVEALRREQHEKGDLIARHREQLLKWSAECQAIEGLHRAQLTLPDNPSGRLGSSTTPRA